MPRQGTHGIQGFGMRKRTNGKSFFGNESRNFVRSLTLMPLEVGPSSGVGWFGVVYISLLHIVSASLIMSLCMLLRGMIGGGVATIFVMAPNPIMLVILGLVFGACALVYNKTFKVDFKTVLYILVHSMDLLIPVMFVCQLIAALISSGGITSLLVSFVPMFILLATSCYVLTNSIREELTSDANTERERFIRQIITSIGQLIVTIVSISALYNETIPIYSYDLKR